MENRGRKKMEKGIKIAFAGTPEIAAIVLEKMIDSGLRPFVIITAKDSVKRKNLFIPSPVKVTAINNNIPVLHNIDVLKEETFDLLIVCAFGKILKNNILKVPKYGCLNIHPSLLPKYRGPSPVQSAILNGDKETGTTIILMDEGIDTGPILSQKKIEITDKETSESLFVKLGGISGELLCNIIPKWINNELKPEIQKEEEATYTKIIGKEDGKINWEKSAEEIERQIRAFQPWPGSFTFFKKNDNTFLRIRILEGSVTQNDEIIANPGDIIIDDKSILIKCRGNLLKILKIQPEGKNPMNSKDFLLGYKNTIKWQHYLTRN